MNGVHDMGGMQGMGPIRYEKGEPVFHAHWESRVYALTRAMRAWHKWNLDAWRHDIELLPAADYLRMTYYEKWLAVLERQVVQYGLVTKEELASGKVAPASSKARPALTPEGAQRITRALPSSKDPAILPLFHVGDSVRARNMNPAGHTRLPRYVRGKPDELSTTMAYTCTRTRTPDTKASIGSMYTRFVSPHESFGGSRLLPAISFISIYGTVTLSTRERDIHSEKISALPQIPRDEEGPVFAEPWQAQAFALAIKLSEQGHFTWKEWSAALAAELKQSEDRGEPDDGSHYYEHWLVALEHMVTRKGLADEAALLECKEAWADGYRHTPHGKPVVLRRKDAGI